MYDFHFFSETVAIITFESHKIKTVTELLII